MSYREPPEDFDFVELEDAARAAYALGGEEFAARLLRFFKVRIRCPRCEGTGLDPTWWKGVNMEPACCALCQGERGVERRADNPRCRWKLWGVPPPRYAGRSA